MLQGSIELDVRPRPEFAAGHIARTRSIPIEQFAESLKALPRDVEIVAYCRGPCCVMADGAVRLLRWRGRPGRRLEGSYPEWQRAQLPIDSEAAA